MIDPFGPHIEAVARDVWGDPNPRLSARGELRWGAHGSRSVDLTKGVWHDHEAGEGGGVLDLLRRERKLVNGAALDYLRETHGADVGRRDPQPLPQAKIAATYDYVDENGELLFQVCRLEPKSFRQRRPEGAGWSWSVKGIRQIPYRLPELISATETGGTVYIVEGEKDADALWRMGIPATCNAGGAGKWPDSLNEHFRGLDVVIVPDNDEAGRNHRDLVGAALKPLARTVRTLDLVDLPPKGDVSDWLAQHGSDASTFRAVSEALSRPWGPRVASRFGAIRWSDIDAAPPSSKWTVEDMLHEGDSCLVYGASQSGKSFLAVDMGLSIARGAPFLGKRTLPGGVIYQAGEGGKGLVKRLKAYRQEHNIIADLPFVLLPAKVDLYGDEDAESLEAEIRAHAATFDVPLRALVIDTLSTASPGANENASEDISRVLAKGERLQCAFPGMALIWVHHKNAGGEKPRGHTSLFANADCAIEVNRDPETNDRSLKMAKVKDGEDGETLGFELQSVTVGSYDDGKPITSCVVRPAQLGTERTSKRPERLPTGQRSFLMLLDDAIDQYGGQLPSTVGGPFNMRGVEWGAFKGLYKAAMGLGRENDAMNAALRRDGDALFSKGLIGRADPWIWLTDAGRAVLGTLNRGRE